jgi:DNA repair protein RadC
MNENEVLGPGPPGQHNGLHALTDEYAEPEVELLRAVFQDAPFVTHLARAPGGWRTLSEHELGALELTYEEKNGVLALQALMQRSYPELPKLKVPGPDAIGRVYGHRLGGLMREVMLAVALDGSNNFLAEVELATGGAHGIAIRPRDILRPLLRIGASSFILVHNHPSGNPNPSAEDIALTRVVAECGEAAGVPLVDHIIVAGRGGGFTSLVRMGRHAMEEDTP